MDKNVKLTLMIVGAVGALNWGLIALGGSGWNIIENLLGAWPVAVRVVYGIAGVSGLLALMSQFQK